MTRIEKFENYLHKITLPQKIGIYLLPALLTGVIIYLDVLPLQEESYDQLTQRHDQIQRDIKRKSPFVLRKKIKKSKQKLLILKSKVQEDKDDLNFLYAKLTNLELAEFNESKWTQALDHILKKSLDLHITINHIKNNNSENKDQKKSILPKKYVEIAGTGSYKDTLAYLNFIESRNFLIKIKNINFSNNPKKAQINFVINFTIYGVNI